MRFAVALIALAPCAAPAQSPQQPNLILSVGGGISTGADLWTLPRQMERVPPDTFDVFALGRRVRSGLTATVSATYHRSPHLGYVAEVGYFGLGTEASCGLVSGTYAPDTNRINQKACEGANGLHIPTNLIGFQGGLTYRAAPLWVVTPYLRATGGLAALGNSFVKTVVPVFAPGLCTGGTQVCNRSILEESSHQGTTWIATLAFGTAIRTGPGYQFRFEIRDFVTSLPIAADSTIPGSNPQPVAKVGTRIRHFIALTAGFDVILEHTRRRRY